MQEQSRSFVTFEIPIRSLIATFKPRHMPLAIQFVFAVSVFAACTQEVEEKAPVPLRAPSFDLIVGSIENHPIQLIVAAGAFQGPTSGILSADEIAAVRRLRYIKSAHEIIFGEFYARTPVIAVPAELLETTWDSEAKRGRIFGKRSALEIVAGADSARALSLEIGQRIRVVHGQSGSHQHDSDFEIVGIMSRTGTSLDNVLFMPIGTFHRLDGHLPGKDGSASALFVTVRGSRGLAAAKLGFALQGKARVVSELQGNFDKIFKRPELASPFLYPGHQLNMTIEGN